jgi:hypothetical protein
MLIKFVPVRPVLTVQPISLQNGLSWMNEQRSRRTIGVHQSGGEMFITEIEQQETV